MVAVFGRQASYTGKSALETALTILHAGGKFGVVAIRSRQAFTRWFKRCECALLLFIVEVVRKDQLYRMEFEKGVTKGQLQKLGKTDRLRGTTITFTQIQHI